MTLSGSTATTSLVSNTIRILEAFEDDNRLTVLQRFSIENYKWRGCGCLDVQEFINQAKTFCSFWFVRSIRHK
jgi:hypothetical protein